MNELLAFIRQEALLLPVYLIPYIFLLLSHLSAVRSKGQICGCLTSEIAGLNPAEGMDVCLCWLCMQRPLRRFDHS
jgi:hypothetical protein